MDLFLLQVWAETNIHLLSWLQCSRRDSETRPTPCLTCLSREMYSFETKMTFLIILKVECWLTLNSFWASARAGHWVGMCDSQVTRTHTQKGQRRPEKGSSTSKSAIWQHFASPIKDCTMQRFVSLTKQPPSVHARQHMNKEQHRHALLSAFMCLWFSVYDGGPFPLWYKTNLWVHFVNYMRRNKCVGLSLEETEEKAERHVLKGLLFQSFLWRDAAFSLCTVNVLCCTVWFSTLTSSMTGGSWWHVSPEL